MFFYFNQRGHRMKYLFLSLRLLAYLLTGCLALLVILVYRRELDFTDLSYHFRLSQLYFGFNLLLLPWFRLLHPLVFISQPENFKSYKTRALDFYHQDLAAHSKRKKWSSDGVNVNPYEYLSPYTMSYDNALNWAYNLCKALLMSILFLLAGPCFWLYHYSKRKLASPKH